MAIKQPPELTWQDKFILIAIPVVVFSIFIIANIMSQDSTVAEAFAAKAKKINVRDGGSIVQVYAPTKEITACRVKSDSGTEFDLFCYLQASDTIAFEIGRSVHFYGQYAYNERGGVVSAPYKDKSGALNGWTIYNSHRYAGKNKMPGNNGNPDNGFPAGM